MVCGSINCKTKRELAEDDKTVSGHFGVCGLVILSIVIGIALSATTISVVHWAGSDQFCTTFCHTMDGSAYAWKQGLHARTASGATAGCSDCHLLHESDKHINIFTYTSLLFAKAEAGSNSLMGQIHGTYETPQKWQENRDRTIKNVINFMTENNFSNCRGCHDMGNMYNPKKPMVGQVHAKFVTEPVNCIMCHFTAGHKYDEADTYIRDNGKFPALEDAWNN